MSDRPAQQGYRMPAEWEPHAATWLVWPHRRSDWPGKFSVIPWIYLEIIRLLHTQERIRLLVTFNDSADEQRAYRRMEKAGIDRRQVDFLIWPTDRGWVRDFGPIFLSNDTGQVALTDWHFNAWAKYADWTHDDAIPARAAQAFGWPAWQPSVNGRRVVLEGGSIDVDGQGTLLTTQECLLSPIQARNPDLSRHDLERVLGDFLGVRKVLWLGNGIVGDDTHGHVDDLTRFVAPGRVVTVIEPNSADANYAALQDNRERLRGMTDAAGRRLEVIELPMPEPVIWAGQRLPASYANFYIGNSVVLVPLFHDPADRLALGILTDLFPGRRVVGIAARDLVWGLGTLHCLSMQEPRGSGPRSDG